MNISNFNILGLLKGGDYIVMRIFSSIFILIQRRGGGGAIFKLFMAQFFFYMIDFCNYREPLFTGWYMNFFNFFFSLSLRVDFAIGIYVFEFLWQNLQIRVVTLFLKDIYMVRIFKIFYSYSGGSIYLLRPVSRFLGWNLQLRVVTSLLRDEVRIFKILYSYSGGSIYHSDKFSDF